MEVASNIHEIVLSLPALVKEVERQVHNSKITVLEALSKQLEDSLDFLRVVDSRVTSSPTSPELVGNIRCLQLILNSSLDACNSALCLLHCSMPEQRRKTEFVSGTSIITVGFQGMCGRPYFYLRSKTLDVCQSIGLSLVHNTTLMMVDVDTDANDDVIPFTIFFRERHETLVSTCRDTQEPSAC